MSERAERSAELRAIVQFGRACVAFMQETIDDTNDPIAAEMLLAFVLLLDRLQKKLTESMLH